MPEQLEARGILLVPKVPGVTERTRPGAGRRNDVAKSIVNPRRGNALGRGGLAIGVLVGGRQVQT